MSLLSSTIYPGLYGVPWLKSTQNDDVYTRTQTKFIIRRNFMITDTHATMTNKWITFDCFGWLQWLVWSYFTLILSKVLNYISKDKRNQLDVPRCQQQLQEWHWQVMTTWCIISCPSWYHRFSTVEHTKIDISIDRPELKLIFKGMTI